MKKSISKRARLMRMFKNEKKCFKFFVKVAGEEIKVLLNPETSIIRYDDTKISAARIGAYRARLAEKKLDRTIAKIFGWRQKLETVYVEQSKADLKFIESEVQRLLGVA